MASIILCSALALHGQSNSDQAKWLQDLSAWRAKHAADISAPDGWLSLVALDWLKPNVNSVGSAESDSIRIPGTPPQLFWLTERYDPVFQMRSEDNKVSSQPSVIQIMMMAPYPSDGHNSSKYPVGLLVDGKPPADSDHEFSISMDNPGTPLKLGDRRDVP